MTKQELIEKRAKLYVDARALMNRPFEQITAEDRSNADRMYADANVIKADLDRLVQDEQYEAEQRSQPGRVKTGDPAASAGVTETRSPEERRKAVAAELRKVYKGQNFEARELTVAGDGTFTIPVGVSDPKVATKSAGSVYQLVNKFRSSSGETIKVPLWNDLANSFILSSTFSETATATDPAIGGVTISIDDIQTLPILINNSLLNDVEFDLVGYTEKSIQARYNLFTAKSITLGNSSNVGALSTGYTGVSTATAGLVGYKDLTAVLASLDPSYYLNANWLMSPATIANTILNITDSNNRPLFLPFADGGISGFTGTIFGFPVMANPFQPAVATGNVAIQFGDFNAGYTFREVLPGVVIKKSSDRFIELNALGIFAFARVGGAVTNPGSVVANTTQPVISLTVS